MSWSDSELGDDTLNLLDLLEAQRQQELAAGPDPCHCAEPARGEQSTGPPPSADHSAAQPPQVVAGAPAAAGRQATAAPANGGWPPGVSSLRQLFLRPPQPPQPQPQPQQPPPVSPACQASLSEQLGSAAHLQQPDRPAHQHQATQQVHGGGVQVPTAAALQPLPLHSRPTLQMLPAPQQWQRQQQPEERHPAWQPQAGQSAQECTIHAPAAAPAAQQQAGWQRGAQAGSSLVMTEGWRSSGQPAGANASEQGGMQQMRQGAPAAPAPLPEQPDPGAPSGALGGANAVPGGAAGPEGGGGRKPGKLKQLFEYLAVYDIEATCDQEKKLHPQEIIELSCVLVNTRTLELGPTFQEYCRPTVHPALSAFCTQLTGITQAQVDAGVSLEMALTRHSDWLREQGLLGPGAKTFVPVSWSDWDMKIMMEQECRWRKLQKPKYLARWIDLKAVFAKHYNTRANLRGSVEHAGLVWEGRAHSAIDDAVNTARLAVKLMQRGIVLGITGSFTGVDASGKLKQATLFDSRPAKKARIYDGEGRWNGKCSCGAKAKKRTVKRPGPTNGKEFWSCGKYTATGGAQCDFFKWADAVN